MTRWFKIMEYRVSRREEHKPQDRDIKESKIMLTPASMSPSNIILLTRKTCLHRSFRNWNHVKRYLRTKKLVLMHNLLVNWLIIIPQAFPRTKRVKFRPHSWRRQITWQCRIIELIFSRSNKQLHPDLPVAESRSQRIWLHKRITLRSVARKTQKELPKRRTQLSRKEILVRRPQNQLTD